MNKYIDIPKYTNINTILNNNFSLSASQYKSLCITNKNVKPLNDLLDRNLNRQDLGIEIGSNSYIDKSNYYFIKTKALQSDSYLFSINKESFQPMIASEFKNMDLKKGDIIISKDSNVGEAVILDKDYPQCMLSSALYKLPISNNKYYILAFIKSDLFRQQIDFLVPKGATIRHGKTMFLNCLIPFPKNNNVIDYVELLVKSIINKETEIRNKFNAIQTMIKDELITNQKEIDFSYSYPSINEIQSLNRLDSCLYSKEFKQQQFLINNYLYGASTISQLGFNTPTRGQNLQVSCIGKSIRSLNYKEDYYKLLLPCYISKYGTISFEEYLGNKNKLKVLNYGEIVFGAEGNEKGRSYILLDNDIKSITNIHGITIAPSKNGIQKSIFIKLFLDYLRTTGMIDKYAVGGNGGSLAIKYWDLLTFPNFPKDKEKQITDLYHKENISYNPSDCTNDNFLEYDTNFNKNAGIYDIDKSLKYIKSLLDDVIHKIINDKDIEIKY